MTALLVLGDSVPHGERTGAAAWPERLPARISWLAAGDITHHGGMGTSLADLSTEAGEALDEEPADEVVVLVHAGHNDAQFSGGDPRVPTDRFRAAATELDGLLSDRSEVRAHAFVGLVPLLSLDGSGGVPFSDAQPERALEYDEVLAAAVETHLPVAEPVEAWRDRTVDGVHPDDAGHAHLAERVAEWLEAV